MNFVESHSYLYLADVQHIEEGEIIILQLWTLLRNKNTNELILNSS